MTYDEYVTQLAALLVVEPTDERFQILLPWITQSAELRILREPTFDFLATRGQAVLAGPTSGADRSVPFPVAIVVAQQVNLLSPANTQGTGSVNIPLLRTTKEFIDNTWPDHTLTQEPRRFETYWALRDMGTDPQILIAPTPNDTYYLTVYGTSRPALISPTNQTDFISREMPDLLMAAAAVYACGSVLKNFGAAADSPEQSMSWNSLYESIKMGISIESMRQKAISSGWSEFPPAPLAGSPRGAMQPGG